jgi:hypothetical protein
MKQIPLLHNKDTVDISVRRFCATAKAEYRKCKDNRDKQREFLLKYVDKIVYYNDRVAFYGHVPVLVNNTNDNLAKLEFVINEKIATAERFGRKSN